MNLASFLGLVGTGIGLVRALPQLLVILRSGRAAGVSVDSTGVSAVVSGGWAAYGLLTHQPFVALATGSSAVVFTLITLFALKYGRSPREFRLTPIWLMLFPLTYTLWGIPGMGLLLPLSVLACNLPQLKTAWAEADLSELSMGTWLFNLVDGALWGSYALLMDDLPILGYGIFQLLTSLVIVALKRHKSRNKVLL
ncbi:MAG: hypothetical protein MI747_13625 [Desulfobacterales bacterium]|nr:hypothetical protein [Desulfobacterales bacterium]